MLTYRITPGRDLLIYDHHEALIAAGTSELESPLHQDQAMESFFGNRLVQHLVRNPETYDNDLKSAVAQGVEVLIVKKEKP
jgi:hypothetical protein